MGSAGLAAIGSLVACLGDDPAPGAPPDDPDSTASDAGGDGRLPDLAPDAAPAAGCPLGCLPPAPAGWTGPSAVFDGPSAEKPAACPSLYTQKEVDAHQGMTADPAQCSCGTGVAQSKCTVNVESHETENCSVPAEAIVAQGVVPGSACVRRSNTANLRVAPPTLDRGACVYASATTNLPPPSFAKENVACGLPQTGVCPERSECVATPLPDAPYGRICIHKEGEHSCPSEDFASRFVAYRSIDDARACGECEGTAAGGGCGGSVSHSTSNTCAGTGTSFQYNTCVSATAMGVYIDVSKMAPTGVTCTTTGGAPEGAASSTDAVTFCCNR
jgi:hypothetical protein